MVQFHNKIHILQKIWPGILIVHILNLNTEFEASQSVMKWQRSMWFYFVHKPGYIGEKCTLKVIQIFHFSINGIHPDFGFRWRYIFPILCPIHKDLCSSERKCSTFYCRYAKFLCSNSYSARPNLPAVLWPHLTLRGRTA